ncbi:MAG TPA: hypothetical protein VEN81_12190, partial [Planctomycetota bacterium]|nr:hypothetical protein [Planctomycetota bacterium]
EASVRIADESGKIKLSAAPRGTEDGKAILALLRRLFDYLSRHEPSRGAKWNGIAQAVFARLGATPSLSTLDAFREAGLTPDQVFGPQGLARYLTCFGNGTVNVNTAPRGVLWAVLDGASEDMVDRIASFRGPSEGRPGSYTPFEEPRDLLKIDGIVLGKMGERGTPAAGNLPATIQGLLATQTSAYAVHIEARAGERKREAWVFLSPQGERLAYEEIEP